MQYNIIEEKEGSENMYREVFPSRIKNARIEAGLTQREVAAESGIPLSTIAKYETGKLEPDLEKLGIIATFYDKSADYFIGRKDK